VQGGATP
jgi:hypothetical protein